MKNKKIAISYKKLSYEKGGSVQITTAFYHPYRVHFG